MGIVARQGIKGTLVAYIGAALGIVNTLWLFPYILSTEQIGLLRVLIDASLFFAVFAQLGIANTSVKFFPYFDDESKQHQGFLFNNLSIIVIGFLLFCVVFFVFDDTLLKPYMEKSPLLLKYKFHIVILVGFTLVFTVFRSYAQSLMRIVIPKIIYEVFVRLIIMICIVLFFYSVISFDEFIAGVIFAYGVAAVLIILYIQLMKQLFLSPDNMIFKSGLFKNVFTYGMFMLLGSSGSIIVGKIDTLMLGSMEGLSNTGIYSIAFYMGIFIELPRRAINQIATPFIAKAMKSDAFHEVKDLYKKTSITQLVVGGLLLLGIWVNIDSIYKLIPNSEEFVAGKYVVLFIGLSKLFDMGMGVNSEILTNSKYYKWNLMLMPLLSVVTILTNLYFIPIYGITGAAIATMISILGYNIIRYLFIYFTMGIQPFTFKTVLAILVILVSYAAGYFLPDMPNLILDLIIRSSVVGVLYCSLAIMLKISPDLNRIFFLGIDKLKKKVNIDR